MNSVTEERGPVWSGIRNEIRAHRAARAERKSLERDLAAYSTPAELTELNAILQRYDDRDVADIRDVLGRRAA